MQEKMPVVIEDVFSVVGCIKHGCIYAPVLQQVDYACQKVIRIADGIVIRVQQVLLYFTSASTGVSGRKKLCRPDSVRGN